MTTPDTVPLVHLSAEQLSHLRASLEEQREERRIQLYALDSGPIRVTDPVLAAHRDAVELILAHVCSALSRMDSGTYGICLHCSAPIPYERLELVPHTPGCVGCVRHLGGR